MAVCVEQPLGKDKLQLFPSLSPMTMAEYSFFSYCFLLLRGLPVLCSARLIVCILPGYDLKIRTLGGVVTTITQADLSRSHTFADVSVLNSQRGQGELRVNATHGFTAN